MSGTDEREACTTIKSGGRNSVGSPATARHFINRPEWVTPDLLGISFCLFFSAMGANAFNQYVIPYLTGVRNWGVGQATFMVAATFALVPLIRLNYPRVHRWLGDRGALALGNGLFLVYLALLIYARGWLAPFAMAITMAVAVGLVFTAGPLQIYDATPLYGKGKASGYFLGSNFLAWFAGNLVYSLVIRWHGFSAAPFAALALSGISILSLGLVPRRTVFRPIEPIRAILTHSRNPRTRTVALFMAMSAASIGLMFGAYAQFTAQTYGPAMTAVLVLGFYGARLPGSLGAGVIADRWGFTPILVGISLATGASLIVAGIYQLLPLFILSTLILGLQQSAVPVAAMTMAGSVAEAGSRHQIHAYVFTVSEITVSLALVLSFLLSSSLTDLRIILPIFGTLYLASAAIAYHWLRPGGPTHTQPAPTSSI